MFARTERLLLRPGWVEDAPALAAAIGNEAIVLNLSKVPWPYDVRDAEAYLGRDRGEGEADFLIFMRTLGSPRLIGGIGLAQDGADMVMGYWIVPSCWGLGFATEAGQAVIAMAQDSLRVDRIVGRHFIDNPASGYVLKKLGFVTDGTVESLYSEARGADAPAQRYVIDLKPALIALAA
jgi:RimJ/RimL family protein N-acetyltransferase